MKTKPFKFETDITLDFFEMLEERLYESLDDWEATPVRVCTPDGKVYEDGVQVELVRALTRDGKKRWVLNICPKGDIE